VIYEIKFSEKGFFKGRFFINFKHYVGDFSGVGSYVLAVLFVF